MTAIGTPKPSRPTSSHTVLMTGKTMHRRIGTVTHRFVYPVLYLRTDLMQPMPTHWLFGHNRYRLLSFFDRDHADGQTPLVTWFKQQLATAGLADQFELTRLELTTQPRVLGFVFNPVSFWAAYDDADQLRVVLCEVNNTFGVRLSYLLHTQDGRPIESNTRLCSYKQLHVSPFYPVSGGYRFRFDLQAQRQHLQIELFEQARPEPDQSNPADLVTTLSLDAQGIDPMQVLKQSGRYGWSTVMVVARIHWQALQLWRKGARFHRSPPKPTEDLHHESTR